jgi:hypothetical protein
MIGEYDGVVDELESGWLYQLKNLLEERVSYAPGIICRRITDWI